MSIPIWFMKEITGLWTIGADQGIWKLYEGDGLTNTELIEQVTVEYNDAMHKLRNHWRLRIMVDDRIEKHPRPEYVFFVLTRELRDIEYLSDEGAIVFKENFLKLTRIEPTG